MAKTMRAKFRVRSTTNDGYGISVKMEAVYDGSPENNQFAQATPSGTLEMYVNNPEAKNFLEPTKEYYLDFTLAE